MIDKYEEHVRDSAPCSGRWDGYCRGDVDADLRPVARSKVLGRMTSVNEERVEVIETTDVNGIECDFYEVMVDGRRAWFCDDRAEALTVGRWWLAGCPR
jgi:hypothetical protein